MACFCRFFSTRIFLGTLVARICRSLLQRLLELAFRHLEVVLQRDDSELPIHSQTTCDRNDSISSVCRGARRLCDSQSRLSVGGR